VKATLPQIQNYTIKLVDIMGKELNVLKLDGDEIQLPYVAEGIYLLQFENAKSNEKFVKKLFIKN
jgi:hypothetical protein